MCKEGGGGIATFEFKEAGALTCDLTIFDDNSRWLRDVVSDKVFGRGEGNFLQWRGKFR